jgi:hypothetical protein
LNREPFQEGVPLSYQATFNREQCARLKTGLIPQQMEDKWFIYYEEPHLISIVVGQKTCIPTYKQHPNGARVTEVLWSRTKRLPLTLILIIRSG